MTTNVRSVNDHVVDGDVWHFDCADNATNSVNCALKVIARACATINVTIDEEGVVWPAAWCCHIVRVDCAEDATKTTLCHECRLFFFANLIKNAPYSIRIGFKSLIERIGICAGCSEDNLVGVVKWFISKVGVADCCIVGVVNIPIIVQCVIIGIITDIFVGIAVCCVVVCDIAHCSTESCVAGEGDCCVVDESWFRDEFFIDIKTLNCAVIDTDCTTSKVLCSDCAVVVEFRAFNDTIV